MNLIAEFNRLARKASFHYADDTCGEWTLASNAKSEALEIFDNHPELQAEIRASFHELWSLKQVRPDKEEIEGA